MACKSGDGSGSIVSDPRNPLSDCGDTVHLSGSMEIPSRFLTRLAKPFRPITGKPCVPVLMSLYGLPQDDDFDNEDVLILRDGTKLASGGKGPG